MYSLERVIFGRPGLIGFRRAERMVVVNAPACQCCEPGGNTGCPGWEAGLSGWTDSAAAGRRAGRLAALPAILALLLWLPSGAHAASDAGVTAPQTWILYTNGELALDVGTETHTDSAGATVTFSYTVSNNGPLMLHHVFVDDPLVSSAVPGCPGELGPDSASSCSATVDLPPGHYKDKIVASATVDEPFGFPCPLPAGLICPHHLIAKGTLTLDVPAPAPPPPPTTPPPSPSPPARPAPPPAAPPPPSPDVTPSTTPPPSPHPSPSPRRTYAVLMHAVSSAAAHDSVPVPVTVLALLLPGVAAAAVAGVSASRRR
jgi:hypothetical protein